MTDGPVDPAADRPGLLHEARTTTDGDRADTSGGRDGSGPVEDRSLIGAPYTRGVERNGGKLRTPRLAEVVAAVLRERIVEGRLQEGLPKQDDLLQEFGISRPSLREALRQLESEGLLSVRRGSVGGAAIEVPSAETSASAFGVVLQSRRGTIGDLALAITKVEPLTAALCAERADRSTEVLPGLTANLADCEEVLEDGPEFTLRARRFHELMVQSCGNETLKLMVGSLETLWSEQERQWAMRAESDGRYPDARHRRHVLTAHGALVRAIADGDAGAATTLAAGHLAEAQRYTLRDSEDQQVVRATALLDGRRQLPR